MTDEAQSSEFLLSGDNVAEAFMGLAAETDPLLLRIVFANTSALFLARERGDADEMEVDEFQEVLVRVANDAFDLIVQELGAIRDDKINFVNTGVVL